MKRRSNWNLLVWAGLLAGSVGCGDAGSDDSTNGGDGDSPNSGADLRTNKSGLLRAEDCDDLLTKIQNDAIAKLDLVVELYKNNPESFGGGRGGGVVDSPTSPEDDWNAGDDGFGGDGDGAAEDPVASPGAGAPPSDGNDGTSGGGTGGDSGEGGGEGPTGSSNTNTQVVGVDEADFVKVVNKGANMFVLHGNQLYKLKSWPAAATALKGKGLKIEGSPSEMFVNDAGKAVVFSSVWGYGNGGKAYDYCGPDWCGGTNFTKVTIADVSGDEPKTEREFFYEGQYISSRRYETNKADVVRVVMQAQAAYYDLYSPNVQWNDPFGNPYEEEQIVEQLTQWRDRTAQAIRDTTLDDWMPLVQEVKGGKLADVAPACDSYYMPQPGLTQYGLTHVLSLDLKGEASPVDGVTIMGATSTVYSNAEQLVLAQPDYRAFQGDFGMVDLQQTALHVFKLAGADTKYVASGFIPGQLAGNIPQFALDEKDGIVRAATTGWERVNPEADEFSDDWWRTEPVNRLVTAKVDGGELKIVDELKPLGKPNETIRSSRFIGDRGYIVTAIQQDPLYVVDLSKPDALKVLGEVEIPGFSEYMHPLDENHLITLGQNASLWGLQLQIFDVTDPTKPTQTAVLDFGDGSSSEGSWQHKAFTYYADKKLLALPMYDYSGPTGFSSNLVVVKVDAEDGFAELGRIDHSALIQDQQCNICDGYGYCYADSCMSYYPEVRRGHFVSSEEDTFVYSFSYGGVLVHDLADLAAPLATVELPAPEWDPASWYGIEGGATSGGGGRPGMGGTVDPVPPDFGGDGDDGIDVAEPPPVEVDAGAGVEEPPPVEQDAGSPDEVEPGVDGGVAMEG